MSLKHFKPYTPSRRSMVLVGREDLWTGRPERSLVESLHSTGGRNAKGRVTCRHMGGGHKRLYRKIDFARQEGAWTVQRIEYDPNRSARIALVQQDAQKAYIVAHRGISIGQVLVSGAGSDVRVGNCLPLGDIPSGSSVFGIEFKIGGGARCVLSAGTFARVLGKDGEYVLVRLPSSEVRRFHKRCRATIGSVGNEEHFNVSYGKAGARRWLGIRPHVRGVAMNPIDHPMGGGEGKSSGGRQPCSPWGQLSKGLKTRHNPRTDRWIVRRRKQGG